MSKKKILPSRGPTLNEAQQMVANVIADRALFLRRMMDPRRDVDYECGHPVEITIHEYTNAFLRGDIAGRVVSVWPEESWSDNPLIFETEDQTVTEFETAWDDLEKRLRLFSTMQRGDILSGVGRFGVILLGLSDGAALDKPVPGLDPSGRPIANLAIPPKKKMELLYLRVFDEISVKVDRLETDITNPRYGHPLMYEIQFDDSNELIKPVGGASTVAGKKVHWTRIVHLADNRTSSEIFGRPRMEKVYNRLLDIKKVAGGSGEMFWKGGFPGLSFETHPSDTPITIDKEATKEMVEQYMNGLQRYLATEGMQVKNLGTQVADPTPHIDMQVRLIAMALGIPWRIFLGSEAAQLASEQDSRAWHRRLARRRQEYITPFVIAPVLDRLLAFGVLPKPKTLIVEWSDLNTPSDNEKADVCEKRTNALTKYIVSGGDVLVPPFHYLTLYQGMTSEEAHAAIDEVGDDLMKVDPPKPPPTAAPRRATSPARNGVQT